MVAGAVAGIGEHVAMYPVDTIKTRMQALAHPGQQVIHVEQKREGPCCRAGWRRMQLLICLPAKGASLPCMLILLMCCARPVNSQLLPLLAHRPQLHSSVGTALRTVLRREGVGGLYRGVTAMALGAG